MSRTHTFEIEDKSYTLKYDYNSICDIEEMAGKPIQEVMSERNVGLFTVRLLLWGGLKWKINGITKQQVGYIINKLIEDGNYEEVVNKAMVLIVDSMPKAKSEEKSEEGE